MNAEDLPNPDYVIPKKFDEAWNHPDPVQREKWRETIRKEFHDMNKRHVWRLINRRDIPPNRRCVKCKWVFNIKRNGVFRARLVACGYSQIPGVDFSENYSPVVHDITFRLLLLAMILFSLSAKIVDVETAFYMVNLRSRFSWTFLWEWKMWKMCNLIKLLNYRNVFMGLCRQQGNIIKRQLPF